MVGAPALLQRRAAPRAEVAFGASIVWPDPATGAEFRTDGRTENLFTVRALVHFDESRSTLPHLDIPALMSLRPADGDGPLTVAPRVLQAWDGGAHLRTVDAPDDATARLRAVLE